MQDLPDIATSAREVAQRVMGEARVVTVDDRFPVQAIAIEGRHLLLLRQHVASYALSLPHDQSWHFT